MISREEFQSRQAQVRAALAAGGFNGLLAWGRGGSTYDHFADVFYLCNFYPQQPFIPDRVGQWRAQGHAALVVPLEGPVTLIADSLEFQESPPIAEKCEAAADVISSVATAINETVPPGNIALGGAEALVSRWHFDLSIRLKHHTLVESEDLTATLRRKKSPLELQMLRNAARLGSHAITGGLEEGMPGATECEIAAAAISTIVRGGGVLHGLGLSSGPWAHTFAPSTPAAYTMRPLNAGDMLRIDVYGSLDGYMFDLARTRIVGAPPTSEQQEMIRAVQTAVRAGIEILRPGQTLGSVARRCEAVFAGSDYVLHHGMPRNLLGGAWGHGLGLAFEEPWIDVTSEQLVQPGMSFALERRISAPGIGGANYEDMILITDSGPEVISFVADDCS